MKKVLLSALALTMTVALSAQGLVSKKGESYLPEAGDYAISIDATPFLEILNDVGAVNAQPLLYTFQFKKFETATTACRYGATIGLNRFKRFDDVQELDNGAQDGDNTVTDETVTRTSDLTFYLGHEMRKGNTRVQGLIGAEAYMGFQNTVVMNSFGNDDSDLLAGTYDLESRSGLGFSVGVRALVGAEFFIAPKLSLGVEAGLALGYSSQAAGEVEQLTVERDAQGTANTNTEVVDGSTRTREFGLNNNLSQGKISLNFHF